MKFILGLIFGMAITFAGAWFLAVAQGAEPVEQTVAQKAPEVAPTQEAETAPPARKAIPNVPDDTPPQASVTTITTGPQTEPAVFTDQPENLAHQEDPESPESPESPEQGSETVWTVFHSEASASGFANYLSHSVDHPFVVTKLGPAQYQVSYSYISSEQAQALADKINRITGAK